MIGIVRSFFKTLRGESKVTDVKCDPGGGASVQAQHFSACGDDSPPLPDDYVLLVPTQRSGTAGSAGYVDPKSQQKAKGGEKRIYGRDSEGNEVSSIWMKNDGTVITKNNNVTETLFSDGSFSVSNANGGFSLLANGNFVVNGVTIDTSSLIVTPNDVEAGGVSSKNHTTSGVTTGVDNSGAPNPI